MTDGLPCQIRFDSMIDLAIRAAGSEEVITMNNAHGDDLLSQTGEVVLVMRPIF